MSSPRRRPCWTTTEGRGAVRTPRPTRLGRFMAPMSVQLLPVEATHEPPFHPANLCPRWDKDLQFQIHGLDVRWAKSSKLTTNLVAVGILARRRAGASSPAERAWQNLGCSTHCGRFSGRKGCPPSTAGKDACRYGSGVQRARIASGNLATRRGGGKVEERVSKLFCARPSSP